MCLGRVSGQVVIEERGAYRAPRRSQRMEWRGRPCRRAASAGTTSPWLLGCPSTASAVSRKVAGERRGRGPRMTEFRTARARQSTCRRFETPLETLIFCKVRAATSFSGRTSTRPHPSSLLVPNPERRGRLTGRRLGHHRRHRRPSPPQRAELRHPRCRRLHRPPNSPSRHLSAPSRSSEPPRLLSTRPAAATAAIHARRGPCRPRCRRPHRPARRALYQRRGPSTFPKRASPPLAPFSPTPAFPSHWEASASSTIHPLSRRTESVASDLGGWARPRPSRATGREHPRRRRAELHRWTPPRILRPLSSCRTPSVRRVRFPFHRLHY